MWTLLLVLGFGGVLVLGDDTPVDCSEDWRSTCPRVDLVFPETEEELNALCPLLLRRMECMLSLDEECKQLEDGFRDKTQRIKSTLEEICREDSPLHAAISANLKCLKGSLKEEDVDSCYMKSLNVQQIYYDYQNWTSEDETDDEDGYEKISKFMCMKYSSMIGCEVNVISNNCGTVAKDAALKVFSGIPYFDLFTCQTQFGDEFMEIIPKLDISEEEKANLLEIFQLKLRHLEHNV